MTPSTLHEFSLLLFFHHFLLVCYLQVLKDCTLEWGSVNSICLVTATVLFLLVAIHNSITRASCFANLRNRLTALQEFIFVRWLISCVHRIQLKLYLTNCHVIHLNSFWWTVSAITVLTFWLPCIYLHSLHYIKMKSATAFPVPSNCTTTCLNHFWLLCVLVTNLNSSHPLQYHSINFQSIHHLDLQ